MNLLNTGLNLFLFWYQCLVGIICLVLNVLIAELVHVLCYNVMKYKLLKSRLIPILVPQYVWHWITFQVQYLMFEIKCCVLKKTVGVTMQLVPEILTIRMGLDYLNLYSNWLPHRGVHLWPLGSLIPEILYTAYVLLKCSVCDESLQFNILWKWYHLSRNI